MESKWIEIPRNVWSYLKFEKTTFSVYNKFQTREEEEKYQ